MQKKTARKNGYMKSRGQDEHVSPQGFHVAIAFVVFFSVTHDAHSKGVTTFSLVLESIILYSTIDVQGSDSTAQQFLSLGISSSSVLQQHHILIFLMVHKLYCRAWSWQYFRIKF